MLDRRPARGLLALALGALVLSLGACTSTEAAPGVAAPKTGTGTGQASPLLDANLAQVACAPTGLCAAVGTAFDPSATSAAVASSDDGGLSWARDQASAPGKTSLTSVGCGPQGCLAVGRSLAGALVYRLVDRASSWSATAIAAPGALAEAVACASKRWCAAIYHDATHRWMATTLNLGRSWTTAGSLPTSTGPIYQLSCASSSDCLVSGVDASGHGLLEVTHDGGGTWSAATFPNLSTGTVWSAACKSATTCLAVVDVAGSATGTSVLESTDGGATFVQPPLPWSQIDVPRSVTCATITCITVGATTAGAGTAMSYATTTGPGKVLALSFAPTTLLSVACSAPDRCVADGLGSLVALSPSVPKRSQQQAGQPHR
jgi:hypothetical protein